MPTETVEQIDDLIQIDQDNLIQFDTNVLRRQMRLMRDERKGVQQTLEQNKKRVKDLNQAIRARLEIVRARIAEEKELRATGKLPTRKRGPKPRRTVVKEEPVE